MANDVLLYLLGSEAPRKTSSGSGPYTVALSGGTIADGTYYYWLVAWPTQDESNIDNAGVQFFELDSVGGKRADDWADFGGGGAGIVVSGGGGAASITFRWASPLIPCDHFTLYKTTGSGSPQAGPMTRLVQINGDQTSVTITTNTAMASTSVTARVWKVDAAAKLIWVDGNVAISFPPTAAFTASAAGPFSIVGSAGTPSTDAVYFEFNARGAQTVLHVNEAITPLAAGGTITYSLGPVGLLQIISTSVFGSPTYSQGTAIGFGEARRMLLVTDMQPAWDPLTFKDYAGLETPKSTIQPLNIKSVTLSVPTTAAHGWDFKRIWMWAHAKARVLIYDENETGYFGPVNQLRGYLAGLPTLVSKNAQPSWQFTVNVDMAAGLM